MSGQFLVTAHLAPGKGGSFPSTPEHSRGRRRRRRLSARRRGDQSGGWSGVVDLEKSDVKMDVKMYGF